MLPSSEFFPGLPELEVSEATKEAIDAGEYLAKKMRRKCNDALKMAIECEDLAQEMRRVALAYDQRANTISEKASKLLALEWDLEDDSE